MYTSRSVVQVAQSSFSIVIFTLPPRPQVAHAGSEYSAEIESLLPVSIAIFGCSIGEYTHKSRQSLWCEQVIALFSTIILPPNAIRRTRNRGTDWTGRRLCTWFGLQIYPFPYHGLIPHHHFE